MADKSQIQTAATPAPKAPAASDASAQTATSTQTPAEPSSDLDSLLAAAFGDEPVEEENTETQEPSETEEPESSEDDDSDDEEDEETEDDSETDDDADDEESEDAEEDEDDDDEESEDAEEDEDDDVPKGLKGVPKGVVKRLQKQSAQIRDLKQQLQTATAITINPGPSMPFADVETVEALDKSIAGAKAVIQWCEANPDGGELTIKGQTVEITPEEVSQRLANAKARLNPDAITERKLYLAERERIKPWATAELIEPEILKPDSPANKFMAGIIKSCPEIKARLNDWEVILAAAAKGYRITLEEQSGKARYVRMELDAKGNPIPPKAKPAAKQAPPSTKAKPTASLSTAKPALTVQNSKAQKSPQEIYSKTKGDPNARLDALLDAAFAA